MMKRFKRIVAVIITATMLLSIGMPAFAAEIEKNFEEYTLGETQEILREYLLDSNRDFKVGTDEYYNFIIEQLLYSTEEGIKNIRNIICCMLIW